MNGFTELQQYKKNNKNHNASFLQNKRTMSAWPRQQSGALMGFFGKGKKKKIYESLRNQKTFSLGVLTVVTEKHMDGGRTQQQHTHHSYKSGYISIHSMPFPWRPPGHSHPQHFLFGCSCRETGNNAIRVLTLNELAAFWVSWPRFSLVCLHTHTHTHTRVHKAIHRERSTTVTTQLKICHLV